MTAPVLKYLEGRGLLFKIEMREALQHLLTVIVLLAMGAMALLAGWLLLMISLAGFLTMHFEWPWMKVTAIMGAAHILFALTAALVTWDRLTTPRWFADSITELSKDRAWLKTLTTKH